MPAIKVPMRDRLRSLTAFGVQRGIPHFPAKTSKAGEAITALRPALSIHTESALDPGHQRPGRTEHLKFDRVVIDD